MALRRTSVILILAVCTLSSLCANQRHKSTKHNRQKHISEEVYLLNDLVARNHNKGQQLARPVRYVHDPVTVSFGLSLVQILDFDEKNQIITLNVWKQYSWYDHFHTWNASDYDGVRKVSLPSDLIWTPDIVLYDNIEKRDNEIHTERLLLHSDGRVEWIPYVVYKSACAVNMKIFPFDTQNCTFKFGSWTYSGQEIDLVFLDNIKSFMLHNVLPNIEWVISNTSAVRNEVTYECCPETYVDLTFSLVITRQWGFFFKFMLLPAAVLSCLTLVIFWIPPSRPDRTGLGTSLMGSFMLLLILVTQISPPSEDIMFVTYICLNMVVVGLATLVSSVMVNLSASTTPVDKWTRKIILEYLAVCTFVRTDDCPCFSSTSTDTTPSPSSSKRTSTNDIENHYPPPRSPLLLHHPHPSYPTSKDLSPMDFVGPGVRRTSSLARSNGPGPALRVSDYQLEEHREPEVNEPTKKDNTKKDDTKKKADHKEDWQCVVKVLDRINFVVFSIIVLCLGIFFFPRPH